MKKSILSFLVLLSFSLSLHAQQIRHERIKEALRVRDILGDSMGSLRSFMVNPEQIQLNTIDSLQGIRSSIQFRSKNIKAGFFPVQFTQQVQSALPYEWNGGSMLPAK